MPTLDELRASNSATVTIRDAASVVGVDPRTFAAELSVHGGSVRSIRIGRRIVIPRESFLAWFDAAPVANPEPKVADEQSTAKADLVREKLLELLLSLESA